MPTDFESYRDKFAASLHAAAAALRDCADVAESFSCSLSEPSLSSDVPQALKDPSDLHDATKGKRKAAHLQDDDEVKRQRKRKPKDPNAPKRPASSYLMFQNEVRKAFKEQNPEFTNAELMGMISDQWKAMSDKEKSRYTEAMKTAKEQYSLDKRAYESRNPTEAADADMAVAPEGRKSQKSRGKAPSAKVAARPPPVAENYPSSSNINSGSSDEEEQSEEEEGPADGASNELSDEEVHVKPVKVKAKA